jgi:hypothetical protein
MIYHTLGGYARHQLEPMIYHTLGGYARHQLEPMIYHTLGTFYVDILGVVSYWLPKGSAKFLFILLYTKHFFVFTMKMQIQNSKNKSKWKTKFLLYEKMFSI